MKRNMLENHPKIEKQKKILHFFSQNETIICKNQTITIKEQRLKCVESVLPWNTIHGFCFWGSTFTNRHQHLLPTGIEHFDGSSNSVFCRILSPSFIPSSRIQTRHYTHQWSIWINMDQYNFPMGPFRIWRDPKISQALQGPSKHVYPRLGKFEHVNPWTEKYVANRKKNVRPLGDNVR